ncbi:hypothetical protein HQ496_13550, partial [bacterium]|nr:hypothetical protein [bacterium]
MNEESATLVSTESVGSETGSNGRAVKIQFPAGSSEVNQDLISRENDLDLFCRTGLLTATVAENPFLTKDTIPAILHPYLGAGQTRLPWPLVLTPSDVGIQVRSLSALIDEVITANAEEGDQRLLVERALAELETQLALVAGSAGSCSSDEALQEARSVLLKKAGEREKQVQAANTAVSLLELGFVAGSLLIGFGVEGLGTLLVANSEAVARARQTAYRGKIAHLASGLENLLQAEQEDSLGGQSADRLAHSTGGAYSQTIDFSSLSHLIDEAPHGTSLGPDRKARIESILNILRVRSEELFGERQYECFRNVEGAVAELKQRVSDFAELTRALHMGHLEVEHQYRSELHDQLFDRFDYESIPSSERKAFPPVLIHIHLSGGDHADIERLFSELGQAGEMRVIVSFDSVCDEHAVPSLGCGLGLQVVARGDTFIEQNTLSDAVSIGEGLQIAARCRKSSVLTVYSGLGDKGISAYLETAIARDSRAVPAFRFDPEEGDDFSDWLNAENNEQANLLWASSPLDISASSDTESMMLYSTPADLLALDPRFYQNFALLDPALDSERIIPLTDYLQLSRQDQSAVYPFFWVRNEEHWMLRCVPGPSMRHYIRASQRSWVLLREWSGLESSLMRSALEKSEKEGQERLDAAIQEAQDGFDARMKEKTSKLAQQIVQNIAAS